MKNVRNQPIIAKAGGNAEGGAEEGLYLNARQAAAELSISPATLYAYVSRGLIRSEPVPGSRAKRYRAEDVRSLREHRAPPEEKAHSGGSPLQWGAPLFDSEISLISEGELYYRGVPVSELMRTATFENVATLLWDQRDGAAFSIENVPVVDPIVEAVRGATNDSHPLDRIMSTLAVAASADAQTYNQTEEGLAATGARIVRLVTAIVSGGVPDALPVHEHLADHWGVPRAQAHLLRMALVLIADHELNASSFTVRCAVSTGSNLYEGVVAGTAALKGPRHGGASGRASAQLNMFKAEDREAQLRQNLELGMKLAGFGHLLYRNGDPRARFLLGELAKNEEWVDLAVVVPTQVLAISGEHANIDFALAVLCDVLNLPAHAAMSLFALGRTAGWIAHAMEQKRSGQFIRPRARYVGPAPRVG